MANLTNIYKISQSDYETLYNNGSIVIGGVTYIYDPNAIYLIESTGGNYVTLDTAQTITGAKTFNGITNFNDTVSIDNSSTLNVMDIHGDSTNGLNLYNSGLEDNWVTIDSSGIQIVGDTEIEGDFRIRGSGNQDIYGDNQYLSVRNNEEDSSIQGNYHNRLVSLKSNNTDNQPVLEIEDSQKTGPLASNVTTIHKTSFYYNKIVQYYEQTGSLFPTQTTNTYLFPSSSGTLALTSDIPAGGISPIISKTWSELKALRDGGTLVPGQFYRITDYTCTTTTTSTSSAGNQFDIIVLALTTNKLTEEACACLHEGDTYFANSKLELWQLWYCLDNDTNLYPWVDSTNGKGVIYRMIDEFGNEAPYDFKNIRFYVSTYSSYCYTFTYKTNNVVYDASLERSYNCCNNIIKEYRDENNNYILKLPFNVFYATQTPLSCYNNIFNRDCYNNIVERLSYNNQFGEGCHDVQLKSGGRGNVFGKSCNNLRCGLNFLYNTIGDFCQNLNVGSNFRYNFIGDWCESIQFGTYGTYNIINSGCKYIKFGNASVTLNYCSNNIVDSGCAYVYIECSTSVTSSNPLQNIHVHSGIRGTGSSNRKTITISDGNLPYTVDVYASGSIDMMI